MFAVVLRLGKVLQKSKGGQFSGLQPETRTKASERHAEVSKPKEKLRELD